MNEQQAIVDILKDLQPKADESWWIKLPDDISLKSVRIVEITAKIVLVRGRPNGDLCAYKKIDVEFVEKY